MLRFFTFGAVAIALASAFALYAINTKTRRIALEVADKKKSKARLIGRIAALKAERAFQARAERIGPAAEALGMQPATGDQFLSALPSELSSAGQEPVHTHKTTQCYELGGEAWISQR